MQSATPVIWTGRPGINSPTILPLPFIKESGMWEPAQPILPPSRLLLPSQLMHLMQLASVLATGLSISERIASVSTFSVLLGTVEGDAEKDITAFRCRKGLRALWRSGVETCLLFDVFATCPRKLGIFCRSAGKAWQR